MKSSRDSATPVSEPGATVLEIQRMSTEDGPGIRTTVFLKGCSLRCAWCHNPESISAKPQVQWIASHCIGCRTCLEVCPSGAISFSLNGAAVDRSLCSGCGACADTCPAAAMERLGRTWDLEDLTNELLKDRVYFEKSGGGVTVSGGEPCLQAKAVETLLKNLKTNGIHTALDTCGFCCADDLDRILPHASLVLFDIKEIDPEKHRRFTGHGNKTILENLCRVANAMREGPAPGALWIRTPIIPGMTAREDTVDGIGRFMAENIRDVVDRWELCAFNNLCADKYKRLGMVWPLKDAGLIQPEKMERFARIARQSVADPDTVVWTGPTRLEEKPAVPTAIQETEGVKDDANDKNRF